MKHLILLFSFIALLVLHGCSGNPDTISSDSEGFNTIEPTRNYEQFPLNVTSNSFDCLGNTITIYFEEKINIRYLEFDNSKSGNNSNTIKTYRITAYS